MARIAGRDYFIFEPTMLRDGSCCIPIWWFTRGKILLAQCWKLDTVITDTGASWRAIKSDGYEVSQEQFLKNFPELRDDAAGYNLPDPSKIVGKSK